ncbi:M50 family metallopeptidase [Sphingomonas sp.]|uniref:M50 family metallopeptidase n=1 Tax=Sphingomonas sp. TaxID=28214 RepID=UPI00286D361D|nr:M50 family metallopeptidase [Sphingomonas sp.]
MLNQPPIWFILIAFLCALGPLVFLHELGHYAVGRLFRVGADSFSIGFGPEIAGWTDKRGTRWKLGLLPLGGYVRFTGDADATSRPGAEPLSEERQAKSFHLKPVWQRFLIVLAGPAANFLIAILIFAGFFMTLGMPKSPPVVGKVVPGSVAAAIGIQAGDRITTIAGRSIGTFEDIYRTVSLRPDQQVVIIIVRGGTLRAVETRLGSEEIKDNYGQAARKGLLGITPASRVFERPPLIQVLPLAAQYTFTITRWMVDGLGQVITGQRSVKELGGTLKMAQIAGQQAALGPFEFFQLVALFSINLGFINLLPVPMLDGGHLVFYAVEAVRRRPVSERAQEWAFRGGLALIFALLMFTTFNDLGSFGVWARLGQLIG